MPTILISQETLSRFRKIKYREQYERETNLSDDETLSALLDRDQLPRRSHRRKATATISNGNDLGTAPTEAGPDVAGPS